MWLRAMSFSYRDRLDMKAESLGPRFIERRVIEKKGPHCELNFYKSECESVKFFKAQVAALNP